MVKSPGTQGRASTNLGPIVTAPHASEIRQELARILESAGFRDSLRLSRFLSFIVEATLDGKAETIKGYTIAVEALGRDGDFDPQLDPVVRVTAGRLRQALARYYAGEGRDNPLVIDLSRGTYVPVFRTAGQRLQFVDQHWPYNAPEGLLFGQINTLRLWTARSVPKGYADALEAESTDALPPDQDQGPRERHLVATKADRFPAIRTAIDRVRRYAGAFRFIVYALCILSILEIMFDIDRPLHGGPNHGLFFRFWTGNGVLSQASRTENPIANPARSGRQNRDPWQIRRILVD